MVKLSHIRGSIGQYLLGKKYKRYHGMSREKICGYCARHFAPSAILYLVRDSKIHAERDWEFFLFNIGSIVLKTVYTNPFFYTNESMNDTSCLSLITI